MYCKYCGVELPDDVKFCTECGKQVRNADAAQNDATQKMETTATSVLGTVDQTQGLQETQEIPRSQESQIAQNSQQIQESSEKKRKISPVLLIVIIAVVVFLVLLFVLIAVNPFGIGSSQDGDGGSEGIEQPEGSGADQGSQGESANDSTASDESDSDTGVADENPDNADTPNEDESSEGEATDENAEEPQDEAGSESTEASSSSESEAASSGSSGATSTEANNDYVLSDSNMRYYSKEELEGMSDYELYLARNEIMARHGRGFNNVDLNNYFNSKGWYERKYDPDEFDARSEYQEQLNTYEKSNADLIREIEAERNSPYRS